MGQLGPWFLMLQVLWTHIHFAANEVGGGRPLVRVWPEDLVRQVLRVQVVVQEQNRRTWEKNRVRFEEESFSKQMVSIRLIG